MSGAIDYGERYGMALYRVFDRAITFVTINDLVQA
jgi:hypothetical protein